MVRTNVWLLAGVVLLGLISAPAQTLAAERIRGTIAGVDGNELQVTTRSGANLKLNIVNNTSINVLSPLKTGDIKQGSFVGVTAIRMEHASTLQALEVHIFPESRRGAGEGHYDWDLEPGSSMTNANVEAIVDTVNGRELTLSYKGGSQKIIVPGGVPVVTFVPADRSLLKTGAQVFIIAQSAPDGSLTAQHINIGKGSMMPPM